jgi:hypothetical protein
MNDLTEEVVNAVVDSEPKRKTKPAPTTAKYVVINGAINIDGGPISTLTPVGAVVELTSAQAKHYNALGRLAPHIED